MTGRNLPDFNVLNAVFDALIDYEPDTLELKPGLAKAWRFTDPKTLVLDLVAGVEFHDGTPFDAEAAKFNFDRYRTDPRSNVKADLNSMASAEVTGKYQVTLHLTRPNVGLPAMLTNRIGLMVSPIAVKKNGPNIDRKPVGTGPFKFVEWQDNVSFTMVRNDHYWRPGLPYLDGIKMGIINEFNTCARTVIAGQADVALDLEVEQKRYADRVKTVVAKANPCFVFYDVFFNYGRSPLNDVRIRQALNYAIDRDAINKVMNDGLGEPSCAPLPTEFWATDPSTVNYYTHDPERAKKLLAEAGYANGIDLNGWGASTQSFLKDQELVVTQLARSGIRVKMTPGTGAQNMQRFMLEKKGDLLLTPTGGFPDPSQLYEALFAKQALRNASGIELPGFRSLLDATARTEDRAQRKAAFAKLQRFVIEQAMQLPQYVKAGVVVMTPKVQNLHNGLLISPKFTEVWLAA
jgi:peptide/nickel transport system substrate-binding protein/glutathione transport system substrate-binding protein